jgi:hypothetical protein
MRQMAEGGRERGPVDEEWRSAVADAPPAGAAGRTAAPAARRGAVASSKSSSESSWSFLHVPAAVFADHRRSGRRPRAPPLPVRPQAGKRLRRRAVLDQPPVMSVPVLPPSSSIEGGHSMQSVSDIEVSKVLPCHGLSSQSGVLSCRSTPFWSARLPRIVLCPGRRGRRCCFD